MVVWCWVCSTRFGLDAIPDRTIHMHGESWTITALCGRHITVCVNAVVAMGIMWDLVLWGNMSGNPQSFLPMQRVHVSQLGSAQLTQAATQA
jgi:hypothetical protein